MKKLILALTIFATGLVASAQTYSTIASGRNQDTLNKSYTVYTNPINLIYSPTQSVFVTVAVDSISGAPAGKFILEHSVDGAHWTHYAGDTASYTNTGWLTKVTAKLTGRDTNSNQSFMISQTPFLGAYARLKITTTSATQHSRYWITIKSSNYAK